MNQEREKPKVEVKKNGRLVVDLPTIPESTIEEMKQTARVLRRSKKRRKKIDTCCRRLVV